MSTIIPEAELPVELTAMQAVEAAYPAELQRSFEALQRGLPVLVECDKELGPYFYARLRTRLTTAGYTCLYLDGRQVEGLPPPPDGMGLISAIIFQLREAVRGAVAKRVIVLPHLDLLTASTGGLTAEAREVIPLLYENPEIMFIGFKDPTFPVPQVIENLFPHRESILGISRERLRYLVTQREARKFGQGLPVYVLYKQVSGANAVRLRRMLSSMNGVDYPPDPRPALAQLRAATLVGEASVPDMDMRKDIGGYGKVKDQLEQEIIAVLKAKDALSDPEEIKRIEQLIPRGMLLWGPPGGGKSLFAKAMASALGAAVTVVSGPELKSKWVGESLPWDEEVFVIIDGLARRLPIGELVEQHSKADVRTWTAADDGKAMLSRVTGFLKHKGPDYVDVLVTQTGRQVRVTGGHSLFVKAEDGTLGEVIADDIEPDKTRVAIPLRLKAPETLRSLNLLDLLAGREDVLVQGYDKQLAQVFKALGKDRVGQIANFTKLDVTRLTQKQRPPLTLGAFQRMCGEAQVKIDPAALTLYSWHRQKNLPAILPLDEDLGEFLGMWAANGSFNDSRSVRVSWNVNRETRPKQLCEKLFGHVTRYTSEAQGDGVEFIVSSALLNTIMKDGLGLQDGSDRKRVPAVIFMAPLPVVAAYLRGYFSGDGTWSGKYIEADTVSRGLAQDIMALLQYFGIVARCSTKPASERALLLYRVRFLWSGFLRTFIDRIGFSDARMEEVRSYLDNMTFKRHLQTPAVHIHNDVLWDLVVEKRRVPYDKEHVYDLSVPDTERFVAGFGNVLVHNSEENLRAVFVRARQSAPAVIIFDEIDSFASARGMHTGGSGVEHSMVNQLLTEMDGFRKEELVFVVGTTNFVESLDPALLRPGRFEFHLHIPYPNTEDRRAILNIYDQKFGLKLSPPALEYLVKRTGDLVEGAVGGTRHSGDHIQAICRQLARRRLRETTTAQVTEIADVETTLARYQDRPELTAHEEHVVATHEAGHAVCALFCEHSPPIDRISIRGDLAGALGFVQYADPAHRYVMTRGQLLDMIVVLFGGREAESLLLDDLSIGSSQDLERATAIARALVEEFGLVDSPAGVRRFTASHEGEAAPLLSNETRADLEKGVREVLAKARARAQAILQEQRVVLVALRDLLLEKKSLDRAAFAHLLPSKTP
jgi:ATP-dependent Zn protease